MITCHQICSRLGAVQPRGLHQFGGHGGQTRHEDQQAHAEGRPELYGKQHDRARSMPEPSQSTGTSPTAFIMAFRLPSIAQHHVEDRTDDDGGKHGRKKINRSKEAAAGHALMDQDREQHGQCHPDRQAWRSGSACSRRNRGRHCRCASADIIAEADEFEFRHAIGIEERQQRNPKTSGKILNTATSSKAGAMNKQCNPSFSGTSHVSIVPIVSLFLYSLRQGRGRGFPPSALAGHLPVKDGEIHEGQAPHRRSNSRAEAFDVHRGTSGCAIESPRRRGEDVR